MTRTCVKPLARKASRSGGLPILGICSDVSSEEFRMMCDAIDPEWKATVMLGRYLRLPLEVCVKLKHENYRSKTRVLLLRLGDRVRRLPVGPRLARVLAELTRTVKPGEPLLPNLFGKPVTSLDETISRLVGPHRSGNAYPQTNCHRPIAFSSLHFHWRRPE